MKKSLYIYQNGELKRKDDSLQFINDKGQKTYIPVKGISEIYMFGQYTINSSLVDFLSKNDIVIHFFNYYDYYSSSLVPKKSRVSGKLLVKQCENYQQFQKRMNLAKKFVYAAGKNIYRNLRYYNGRGKDLSREMTEIESLVNRISSADSINSLLGFEGNINKVYYSAWSKIVNQEIDFHKRVKRPPDNMINSMISYLNSLVYTTTLSEIYKTQLDPTISFLHEPGTSRFSLSLDIAEIFKPLIADRLIFSLLNKNQIQKKHFTKELEYLHLEEKGSKIVLQEYDAYLNRTIKHKVLNKKVSYKYLIRLECYKLIKHLLEEKEYDPFIMWW